MAAEGVARYGIIMRRPSPPTRAAMLIDELSESSAVPVDDAVNTAFSDMPHRASRAVS